MHITVSTLETLPTPPNQRFGIAREAPRVAAALTIRGLMPRYEYKVVPAPAKGLKAKGIRSPEARFAHALASAMNELGAAGWSYLRTDTLPAEERAGLTRTRTTYHNMLVFRRDPRRWNWPSRPRSRSRGSPMRTPPKTPRTRRTPPPPRS